MWFDTKANWKQEKLVVDLKDISQVPQYPPSVGWDEMLKLGRPFPVPATWDEVYPRHHGVGWYWRTFHLPKSDKGKVIRLKFGAVRLRAEVYLNRRLVGYSLEGSTPFEVNITHFLRFGADNLLAVRITNPGGGTSWHDFDAIAWGNVDIPDSHDFGGIWQNVSLLITPRIYVQNVYVMPLEDLRTIRVIATVANETHASHARLVYRVYDSATQKLVAAVHSRVLLKPEGREQVPTEIRIPDAQPWLPSSPHLYRLETSIADGHNVDTVHTIFGLRFFTERDGKFFLNGHRVFIRSAINWGYYPNTVAFPTPVLAEKEVRTAKALGLNMLSCHRTACTPALLKAADRLGLMIYEEPGGAPRNQPPEPRSPAEAAERDLFLQKVSRLVKRDRDHPSLIWWNMANEAGDISNDPEHLKPFINAMMRLTHRLDPSRFVTYTSARRATVMLLPYQNTYGLTFDYHTIDTLPGVWRDVLTIEHSHFKAPDPREAFYNGESRSFTALSNMPALARQFAHAPQGSYGAFWPQWNRMLTNSFQEYHLERYFKDPEELCRQIGIAQGENVAHELESIRLSDSASGIAFQGWDSHIGKFPAFWLSGIVDPFRNPNFPPQILAKASEPVHLAVVPLPSKAFAGERVHVRIALINERQVRGPAELVLALMSPDGATRVLDTKEVEIQGSEIHFVQDIDQVTVQPEEATGNYHLRAELEFQNTHNVLKQDRPLLVENRSDWSLPRSGIEVQDPTNTLNKYFEAKDIFYPDPSSPRSLWQPVDLVYNPGAAFLKTLMMQSVSEQGRTLLILAPSARSGQAIVEFMKTLKVLPSNASMVPLVINWFGGWEFDTPHPIFSGLPAPVIYGQNFSGAFGYWGITPFTGTLIAGLINAPPQVAATMGELGYGKGKILFSSLNLVPFLDKDPVATRIFAQLLTYAVKNANVSTAELKRIAAGHFPD